MKTRAEALIDRVLSMGNQQRQIKESGNSWDDNTVQFARLISEINAALDGSQMHDLMKDLSVSMDLDIDRIDELFERADRVWKSAVNSKRSEDEPVMV
jgi:hypothetical protein